MTGPDFVLPPPPQPVLPIQGSELLFPVRRIWCVGRNYLDHIREMGNNTREEPFFFAKHADMIALSGTTIPYPPMTKDLQHEVELVVALKSGGTDIAPEAALDHVFGYGVGIDLTRRDLQLAARRKERPWEAGKSFDHSAPCSQLAPVNKAGHPTSGAIWLRVNGILRQSGDLNQMIWSVAEILAQLSKSVALRSGDIILTGTPAGVGSLERGDAIECGIDGVATLSCSIRSDSAS
ncbi:MAG: fumarylacetoacetate hydrolase family protein [Alphaproteobacteria bacterium]|nr:fumarylacetoacetate hydrolase family protein [Alphaproteobacteria bacterium]